MTATVTAPAPAPGAIDDEHEHTAPADVDTAPSRGLVRLRIAVLGLGFAVVGAGASAVFDRPDVVLLVAPLLPTLAAIATVSARAIWRLLGAVLAVVAAGALAAIVHDGRATDLVVAVTSGIQRLLSTEWPSPQRSDLVVTVATLLAAAAAVGHELARRRRFHLVPLVPLLACALGVIGLSAPVGVRWWWPVLLAGVVVLFAVLRNEGTLHDRLVLLRGERSVVPILLVGALLVGLVTLPLTLTDRADPRRQEPAGQTAPLLDPIQSSVALRELDPAVELHEIVPAGDEPLPTRWRTAALSTYDGARWSPSLQVRPIGTTLGVADGPVVRADVAFLDPRLSLVPLPGTPVSVDAPIETDPNRTIVRLVEPPDGPVAVVAEVAPTTSEAIEQGVASRLVDASGSPLTDLAERLAGDGAPLDRLTRLENALRGDDFVLDTEVQGGGLQLTLIERFLRDTQRGNREQFVTAFVLLAQSLGIEARVATGFLVGGESTAVPPGEAVTLTSADAHIWPEVQLTGGDWLAFDPVPAEEARDDAPTPPEPQVQTPAAPQPPIPPPPEPDTETTPPEDDVAATTTGTLSTVLTWLGRGAAVTALAVLPFLVAAAVVLGVKFRRRRRRLAAPAPEDRIRGAWASATDALVDAGLAIEASRTDGEIVERAEPLVSDARRDLRRLATLAGAATYGTPTQPQLLAEDASRCLETIEAAVVDGRTPLQRLRWRLSLRSLRPSTRSPVSV